MILNLYKQRGETPLECIQRFVAGNPEIKGRKMTYLGRLDPLAEGVLLVATDEDVYRKEEFLGLDKEYDFVSLFGFATDTYDVLGKILRVEKLDELNEMNLIKIAGIYEGDRDQKYPEYSSKMIAKKKSLTSSPRPNASGGQASPKERGEKNIDPNFFTLPLGEGRHEVRGEAKKITIHKLKFHGLDKLNSKELFGRLLMDISKVKGNFRQSQILSLWKEVLLGSESKEAELPPLNVRGGTGGGRYLGRFSAHVSSGTYIRGIVNDMGNTLGCGATTLSIKRNRVGNYLVKDSILF